ncbi:MAG: DUF5615 family PIN-like protein [Fimbriimonas sp.]
MRTIWLDAQLPPALATWLNEHFAVQTSTLARLGMDELEDDELFLAAKLGTKTLISKDRDMFDLIRRIGPPPQLVWVRCGNTSNANLIRVFASTFEDCLRMLDEGESV